MKLDKAKKRENARRKRQHGMRVDGKSVHLIQEILIKRGKNVTSTQR